jgi:hypothetical protein
MQRSHSSNVNSLRVEAVQPYSCQCLDTQTFFVSEIKQDHPLNLSISISGGEENNYDCLSNGE